MIRLFPDLKVRSSGTELMDDPACDTAKLLRTVDQFEILNLLFSSSGRLIKRHLFSDILTKGLKSFSLIDIGAGGGDIARQIVKYARSLKIDCSVICIDSDERIADHARKQCRNYPEIEIRCQSLSQIPDIPQFDYAFANHFLHHIRTEDIHSVLHKIDTVTLQGFLINDIRRSLPAYLGYSLAAGLFFHRSFAFYDGRLSIQRGFTVPEMKEWMGSDLSGSIQILTALPSRIALLKLKPGRPA